MLPNTPELLSLAARQLKRFASCGEQEHGIDNSTRYDNKVKPYLAGINSVNVLGTEPMDSAKIFES